MRTTAVISIEGVLVRSTVGQPVIPEGRRLLETLRHRYSVVFLTTTSLEPPAVESWLRRERLQPYMSFEVHRPGIDPAFAVWKVQTHDRLRGGGVPVELFVDADPQSVAAVLSQGTPTMLVSFPAYTRPEWRPDVQRPSRSWLSLIAEVERQRRLDTEDDDGSDEELLDDEDED